MTLPRILLVSFHFHPIIGGVELQSQRLAAQLAARGVEVAIVAARFRGLRNFERVGNVPVCRNFCPTTSENTSRVGIYAYLLSLGLYIARHAHAFDILHANQGMFPAAVMVMMGKSFRKKTVVQFGGYGANADFENLSRLRFGRAMTRAILQTDAAIATSAAQERELSAYGFRAQQITRIPYGVATRDFFIRTSTREELALSPTSRIALFVGNLRPIKGIDILLNAWQRVAREIPDAHLVIVGDGAERANLEAQAARLQIAACVQFVGAQSDPRAYYSTADLFVLPSRSEGFPNVILEALAAGLPCVASNVGGITDQIAQNENGLLVPPENAYALADVLVQLFRDNARRRSMSERARVSAVKFDWKIIAPQYLELYQRLMGSSI